MMYSRPSQSQDGFALLITIVVVGVIISIGLSVLDLSIKQIRLSTNSKDSEIAFHAAYGGVECGRYWRKTSAAAMETGQAISPRCFDVSFDPNILTDTTRFTRQTISSTADGAVYRYQYRFTWGVSPDQKCTQITTLVASSTALGTGLTIPNVNILVPGYASSSKRCEAGQRCTVLSSRGYNRPCSSAVGDGSFGTVQREVLVEF
jgi:Tfp pilus assembly protein PilX